MDAFTPAKLGELLADRPGPCVSLYTPTHPGGSEQDPVRWKHVLRQAERRLTAAGVRAPEVREQLTPAGRLVEDAEFWKGQTGSLAAFLAPGFGRTYRLGDGLPETAAVGPRFHVLPLLPWLAGDGRFYVLALSQNAVRLLRGTRHGHRQVDLRGAPADKEEALRAHDRDEVLSFHTHGRGAGAWEAVFHGQGVGIDDAKDEITAYFRRIDRALHPLLKDEKAPLVLATVVSLMPLYRAANSYAHLAEPGLAGNPDRQSDAELHARAWPLVEAGFRRARDRAVSRFHALAGTGRTATDPAEVVAAAVAGRVEELFAAAGAELWGRPDPAGGPPELHPGERPGDEELVNFAAVCALRHGRTVHVLPPADMPGGAVLAATYPLPMDKHGKRP
jgi:Bacterial archaeo-eukaryotic release factor family 7